MRFKSIFDIKTGKLGTYNFKQLVVWDSNTLPYGKGLDVRTSFEYRYDNVWTASIKASAMSTPTLAKLIELS